MSEEHHEINNVQSEYNMNYIYNLKFSISYIEKIKKTQNNVNIFYFIQYIQILLFQYLINI